MKKKILSLILVSFISFATIGCNMAAKPLQPIEYARNGMVIFPTYAWTHEDLYMLASISANTFGTKRERQVEVLNVLQQVYYYQKNITVAEYISRYYIELYEQPTLEDFYIVEMIRKHQWAPNSF